MAKIIVEFSGWVECDSDKVKFQYISNDDDQCTVITGTEWLKLSEDEQDDYVLEDCIEAQRTALDGEYEHLDVLVQHGDGTEVYITSANRTYS